jgi:hypothetical protein
MTNSELEKRIARLEKALQTIMAEANRQLDKNVKRDIVSHLVAWNRVFVECKEALK